MTSTIRTEQLTKHYRHTVALDALDLEVGEGEVFGYLGPNGAGKSTTIALLLGLIRPTAGSAWIFDLDVRRDSAAIHRRVAYVPSEASLWPSLTGEEALRFLGNVHGSVDHPYRDELVDRFDLSPAKKIRAYSHGNRQKVLLIAAFASRADLLLLDEPTTGLDPLVAQVFQACVREAKARGQTVLLSSHILSEVEAVCDRVAMLRAGRIIETGRLDVLRSLAALRVRARLAHHPAGLAQLAGVTNVVVDGDTIECDVRGPMTELVEALAAAGVQHMTTREPSLEELFMAHYGGEASRVGWPVSAERAIAGRAFRQLWRTATVWALVFGATVASSALTYVSSFPTAASRHQIAATTGADTGFAILLGPVASIDTVGGYTVYKCFVTLTAIGALWGMLATTKILRGEEDSGRWQLVLAGDSSARRATTATLAALAGAVGILFIGTTAVTMLAGRDTDVAFGVGESLLYGLSIAIPPAVFVAVGAVASQLGRTRRMASGLAAGVFGVTFVTRMIADSGPGVHWLRWLTPFGWTELVRPFAGNDPWPLLPAVLTAVALGAVAVALAGRRDAGDGVLASADVARLRPFGLRSPFGLAARLELPSITAWVVGIAALGFAFGVVAKVTTGNLPTSFGDALAKFGVHGSFPHQFMGVAFLITATVICLLPAGQVGAAFDEEASGRFAHVFVRRPRRATLLAGRIVLGAGAVTVTAVGAGLAAWAGAKTQGIELGLGTMLGVGLNLVPTAMVALGLGVVVLAIAPRWAGPAVYAATVWSAIADIVTPLVSQLTWLDRTSLFHYMALAPADDVDGRTILVTLAVAVALWGIALVAVDHRDTLV